jgi:hypothetical protein
MKDWQPAVINKIKQKGQFNFCQFRYDKGSMCNRTQAADRYVYDKSVAPRCTSPLKFKNWSVFQVLRKELRCNKKQHVKIDRKAYLKKKYEDYEKSIKPIYIGNKPIYRYYSHVTHQNENKKMVTEGNSTGNDDPKQNSTQTPNHEVPTTTEFTRLMMITPAYSVHSTTNSSNTKPTLGDKSNETSITETDNTTTSTIHSASTLSNIPTSESTDKYNDLISDNLTYNQQPDITTIKSDDNITNQTESTDVAISAQNVLDNKSTNLKSKKEKQKVELLTEMKEKAAAKQKLKQNEPNYMLEEENGKQIKLSKKAWKLELERKRHEKLKRYQTKN